MTLVQQWQYEGRNDKGKVVKGRMEAPSEAAVIARIRGMGLSPVSVAEASAGTGLQRDIQIPGLEKTTVPAKDLSIASRQLATMVGAGLPILRALSILADQTENKLLASTLGEVRSKVEQGTALSNSIALYPRIFPPLMIQLVRAGETGGFLDDALRSIADSLESDVKLRQTVKSAMTYPVVVLAMSLLAVVAMLIFIVPVFQKMFEDLGSQLPAPTQFLVWLSSIMIWLGPVIIILVVIFNIWWARNKHERKVRSVVDPIKLKLPVFGSLMKKIAIARVTRNLSTLVGAGVPILKSLSIVSEASGNIVIEDALARVGDGVRVGQQIAQPLMKEPVFPTMVTQMIAVGEDAGSLQIMLSKIADFYDSEVEATTEALTALIEPLLIAFLGIVVGGMIVALYLPIFSIIGEVG